MNEASDAALPLWAQHAIWIAGQPEVMMVLAGLLLASLFLVARRRFVRDPVSVLVVWGPFVLTAPRAETRGHRCMLEGNATLNQ